MLEEARGSQGGHDDAHGLLRIVAAVAEGVQRLRDMSCSLRKSRSSGPGARLPRK